MLPAQRSLSCWSANKKSAAAAWSAVRATCAIDIIGHTRAAAGTRALQFENGTALEFLREFCTVAALATLLAPESHSSSSEERRARPFITPPHL